jgi:hypothetical protein
MSPFVARDFAAETEQPDSLVGDPDITIAREWEGERCFILGNGESVTPIRHLIPRLTGRFIAIKLSVALRPDADVMFISGKRAWEICEPMFHMFTGQYIIARGRGDARFPPGVKRIGRTKLVDRLCEHPHFVAGLDAGTSAVNLAYHFGAAEIVLIGIDYFGARWSNKEYPHFMPAPPLEHQDRHLLTHQAFGPTILAKGVKVWNTSKQSRLTCYPKKSLEHFL